jgi:cytochrome P450 family 135
VVATAPELPPGPSAPQLLQTAVAWGPWGDRAMLLLQRRYGDVFSVNALPTGRMVFVADPQEVKRIFTGSPETFHAGEGNAILAPVLGQRSVLVSDGSEHLRRRKLMLPMFHGEAVRAYAEIIREVARNEIDSWPLDTPIRLWPRMRAVTFEVIMRAVFGVEEPGKLAEFRASIPALVDVGPMEMLLWVAPSLGSVWPWRRYRRAQERAAALLRTEIATRRTGVAGADSEGRDILSLLVRSTYEDGEPLDDDDVRDQLVTLLLAGHETTGTSLAWAFERLLATPEAMGRAIVAAHDGDDAYLDAVVQETLRMRPVIQTIARTLTEPAQIAGYTLPAGISVMPSIGCIHASPEVYPEPERFRPERFLDGDTPSYGWIPFGGGTRRCLGAAFAQLEMRLVLGEVLRRTTLRRAGVLRDLPVTRHITNVPSRGVPVRVLTRAG